MKIRSLLLGSVAAAGLTTGAFATDLGVETSLDVCDALGLTGLTISSDTNCLQISGGVNYSFAWGDYIIDNPGTIPDQGQVIFTTFGVTGDSYTVIADDGVLDHESTVTAWLQFVGTADSSFGPASATIKLLAEDTTSISVDQAWVSIGEGTVLMAGLKDSIFKDGEDEPLNFLGLFNSESVDAGVTTGNNVAVDTGGEVIQVVTSMDNVWLGGALEDLDNDGTAVGVIAYSTDDVKAHLSVAADGILTGTVNDWIAHAGFTGTWDTITVVGAFGANNTGEWNTLGSIQAVFDTFTLAASGEATHDGSWGIGGSIAAAVSDGVTIKLGGRFYDDDTPSGDVLSQVAAQVVADVSDEVTLTGEVGIIANGPNSTTVPVIGTPTTVFYAAGSADWNPGGDFTASVGGEVNSLGGFKGTFEANKTY